MTLLVFILVIVISLPVIVVVIEIFCAMLPQKKYLNLDGLPRPKITVLIPAHNEADIINDTIISIKKQLMPDDRLLIIADNCTDDTAQIARHNNVEVVERFDDQKRGKGFALEHGIKFIEKDSPQVVIIIDADCFVDDKALDILAKMAYKKHRPIQALYLMSYSQPTIKQRIAEFAWIVKNYVRPKGLTKLGMPCQLMGTGMAFPWEIIASTNLATSNIVEDMKMGLDMAANGFPPVFCQHAIVKSKFPETQIAEHSQKMRWEHGHIFILSSLLPSYFIKSLRHHSLKLMVMCLDIFVPPLSLLVLIVFSSLILTVFYYFYFMEFYPLAVTLMASMIFSISILLSWIAWGRSILSFSDLLRIPYYVLRKIPLYVLYIFKRQREWVRTDRDHN